jgi:hypothetical protein
LIPIVGNLLVFDSQHFTVPESPGEHTAKVEQGIMNLKADITSHKRSAKPFAVFRLEHEMLHLFISSEVPGIVVDGETERMRIIASYLSPYVECGCEVVEKIALDSYLLPV